MKGAGFLQARIPQLNLSISFEPVGSNFYYSRGLRLTAGAVPEARAFHEGRAFQVAGAGFSAWRFSSLCL